MNLLCIGGPNGREQIVVTDNNMSLSVGVQVVLTKIPEIANIAEFLSNPWPMSPIEHIYEIIKPGDYTRGIDWVAEFKGVKPEIEVNPFLRRTK